MQENYDIYLVLINLLQIVKLVFGKNVYSTNLYYTVPISCIEYYYFYNIYIAAVCVLINENYILKLFKFAIAIYTSPVLNVINCSFFSFLVGIPRLLFQTCL